MSKQAIYVRVVPQHINLLNRIMEGYEYLGVVSTVESGDGLLVIRVTPDTYGEVCDILGNLPFAVEFVEDGQAVSSNM